MQSLINAKIENASFTFSYFYSLIYHIEIKVKDYV